MLSQGDSPLRLCLVCALAVVFCLQGCYRKEPAGADNPVSDKVAEPARERAEYANDLDRLDQLTGRINRACRGSHVVVLGAGDSAVSSGLISVDYALFDSLSDDGAAVLVAEAIAARSKLPSQMQTQADARRVVLETDETVGRYIAKAGFSSAGFAERLNAEKLLAVGLQQSGVPDEMRIAAFMSGYSSERPGSKEGR